MAIGALQKNILEFISTSPKSYNLFKQIRFYLEGA